MAERGAMVDGDAVSETVTRGMKEASRWGRGSAKVGLLLSLSALLWRKAFSVGVKSSVLTSFNALAMAHFLFLYAKRKDGYHSCPFTGPSALIKGNLYLPIDCYAFPSMDCVNLQKKISKDHVYIVHS